MSEKHHDRVRAILLVHRLEADRRNASGEGGGDVTNLSARVARVQAELGGARSPVGGDAVPRSDADGWLLAVYDAALVELCGALGVREALTDERVCSEAERRRVELQLLSAVLPLR